MDRELERAIKKLVSMYGELETRLLIEIATHFKYNDKLLNADYWRLQKLEELGTLNKKAIKLIAEISGKTPNEVKKALKKIGYMSYDEKTLKNAYNKGLIRNDPTKVSTKYIDKAILDSYNSLSNSFIEISQTVEENVRRTYLDIVDKTYIRISEGESYNEAIREAIDELSRKGIRTIAYQTPNGIRNYNIEGLVRRETLTAVRQLNGRVEFETINELGVKKIYLSEHLDCRPTHFDWQGTIINVEDLVAVTDYGSVTGLYGINCRHYMRPYFGDKEGNDLKKYTKEECEEAYKISQRQRYLERGIRRWKNAKEMYKANGDEEEYRYANKKVNWWVRRIENYIEDNNLRRDFDREY